MGGRGKAGGFNAGYSRRTRSSGRNLISGGEVFFEFKNPFTGKTVEPTRVFIPSRGRRRNADAVRLLDSRYFIRTVPALQYDPDRPEDLDTSAEDHVADEARYACMSRLFVARPVERKPSDHVVLMAGADDRVNYFRPDDGGKPEIVSAQDVVKSHCARKERGRRRDAW